MNKDAFDLKDLSDLPEDLGRKIRKSEKQVAKGGTREKILELFKIKPVLSIPELHAGLYRVYKKTICSTSLHTAICRLMKDEFLERTRRATYSLKKKEQDDD